MSTTARERSRPIRRVVLHGVSLCLLPVCLAAQAPSAPRISRADADRCQQKIDRIARIGFQPRSVDAGRERTSLSEREMNAYLKLVLQTQLPKGVIDPAAVLVGRGQFAVRAVFDLDAVRGPADRGMTDPMRYLGGRVPVSIDCILRTRAGHGTLEFRSAMLNDLPVPKFVVQELVSYATRSADYPQGFQFDEPFALPANILELEVNRGEAVVIQ